MCSLTTGRYALTGWLEAVDTAVGAGTTDTASYVSSNALKLLASPGETVEAIYQDTAPDTNQCGLATTAASWSKVAVVRINSPAIYVVVRL